MRKRPVVSAVLAALATLLAACSPAAPEPRAATQAPAPTAALQFLTPTALSPDRLPFNEAEVSRVSVQAAKAAFDAGYAVIVDVRDTAAFERSHVEGALSIQLGEVETNAAGLRLDKDQWIITYCT
jgi:hypothetical protein